MSDGSRPKGVSPVGFAMWKAAVKEVMDLPQGRLAGEVAPPVSSPHDAEVGHASQCSDLEGRVRGAVRVGCQPVQALNVESATFAWPNGFGQQGGFNTPLVPSPFHGHGGAGASGRPISQAADRWMAEMRHGGTNGQVHAPPSEPTALSGMPDFLAEAPRWQAQDLRVKVPGLCHCGLALTANDAACLPRAAALRNVSPQHDAPGPRASEGLANKLTPQAIRCAHARCLNAWASGMRHI